MVCQYCLRWLHMADGRECELQGEIPPQAEMRIGGVMGFVPYAATASLLASAMAAPPGMQVLCLLLCNSCGHPMTPSSIEKGIHGVIGWPQSGSWQLL